jgi:hypothetical protein
MAYVFNRTGGDAQKHLLPKYADDAPDCFLSAEEMIDHLASILEDPFKKANARLDYRGLMMKTTETFAEFYTQFLHLSGQAQIPQDDLLPDLFDKLTVELQRAALPVFPPMKDQRELATQCLALDQGLRRIKARTERIRARNITPVASPPPADRPRTNQAQAVDAPLVSRPSRASTLAVARPVYSDAQRQALSSQGACFSCHKVGHMARDCPEEGKRDVLIQDIETSSGKERP